MRRFGLELVSALMQVQALNAEGERLTALHLDDIHSQNLCVKVDRGIDIGHSENQVIQVLQDECHMRTMLEHFSFDRAALKGYFLQLSPGRRVATVWCPAVYPPGKARSAGGGCLLFGQCLLEGLLSVSDEMLIACRVNKDAGAILRISLKFREHIEITAVCAKKNIARQSPQHGKRMLKILNNAGVAYGVFGCRDEVILRPETDPTHDNDVAQRSRRVAWNMSAQSPRGTAARMTRGLMGSQRYTAERDIVIVVENPIDMNRGVGEDIG